MVLQLDGFDLLDAPADLLAGAPMQLPIDSIDEDPEQPRHDFDPESLQELADTIRERGVRQPISVRRHPGQPGRWMLNFGARRLRASKLAGKAEIPAFVDHAADSYDQVIENEQRDALKPLDVALFVQRRIAAGDSQADIARRLGKSRAYVTLAMALIDAPDWLMSAYREGRCKGMTELYELRRLHELYPESVETLAAEREPITRERIQGLRHSLQIREAPAPSPRALPATAVPKVDPEATGGSGANSSVAPTAACRVRQALAVELNGETFELLVIKVPRDAGHVFIKPLDRAEPRAVAAAHLKLIGFITR